MAEALLYICNHCGHAIKAWSDGNPYFINEDGVKEYAYHPDHERLSRCIGNDSPHLCLDCGQEFMVDSQDPAKVCVRCESNHFVDLFKLENCTCPYCKLGKFLMDPNFYCIS